MTRKEFDSMQKEILMNMRFMDSTIKGITGTPEYKENSTLLTSLIPTC